MENAQKAIMIGVGLFITIIIMVSFKLADSRKDKGMCLYIQIRSCSFLFFPPSLPPLSLYSSPTPFLP